MAFSCSVLPPIAEEVDENERDEARLAIATTAEWREEQRGRCAISPPEMQRPSALWSQHFGSDVRYETFFGLQAGDAGLPLLLHIREGEESQSAVALVRTSRGDSLRRFFAEKTAASSSGGGIRGGDCNGGNAESVTRTALTQLSREYNVLWHLLPTSAELLSELHDLERLTHLSTLKFGVVHCRTDQETEAEMLANECGTPDFDDFLASIGERIDVAGWPKYKGGLDVRNALTGRQSVFAEKAGWQVMFHVSTLLAFNPSDPQHIERKRHIGNDIVVVVHRAEGCRQPFRPESFRSQFNHVFIVLQPERQAGPWAFRATVLLRAGVSATEPRIPPDGLIRFDCAAAFGNWLHCKLVACEFAALASAAFLRRSMQTRQLLLTNFARFSSTCKTLLVGSQLISPSPSCGDEVNPKTPVRRFIKRLSGGMRSRSQSLLLVDAEPAASLPTSAETPATTTTTATTSSSPSLADLAVEPPATTPLKQQQASKVFGRRCSVDSGMIGR